MPALNGVMIEQICFDCLLLSFCFEYVATYSCIGRSAVTVDVFCVDRDIIIVLLLHCTVLCWPADCMVWCVVLYCIALVLGAVPHCYNASRLLTNIGGGDVESGT